MDSITIIFSFIVFFYGTFFQTICKVMIFVGLQLFILTTKKFKKISEANATLITQVIAVTIIMGLYFIVPFLPFILDLFHFTDKKDSIIYILFFFLGMTSSRGILKLKKKKKSN